MYIIIQKKVTYDFMFALFYLYLYFVQIFILERQKLYKKMQDKVKKTCSCVFSMKRYEGDLVHFYSVSFISSPVSELTYPIGLYG